MVEDFNFSLGRRLRAARRQRGWSLGDIESHTKGEFKASVVGAYERGERAISVQRFARLAEIYGVPAAELLPLEPTTERVVIDLDAVAAGAEDLVERYLAAIQLLRKEPGGKEPGGREFRYADRAVITSLLRSVEASAEVD